MTYNIKYKCEKGEFGLEGCTKFPKESELKEIVKNIKNVGLGKLLKIEIEIK